MNPVWTSVLHRNLCPATSSGEPFVALDPWSRVGSGNASVWNDVRANPSDNIDQAIAWIQRLKSSRHGDRHDNSIAVIRHTPALIWCSRGSCGGHFRAWTMQDESTTTVAQWSYRTRWVHWQLPHPSHKSRCSRACLLALRSSVGEGSSGHFRAQSSTTQQEKRTLAWQDGRQLHKSEQRLNQLQR